MAESQLLELAQQGDLNKFESRCLELLGAKQVALRALVKPFQQLERQPEAERLATLAQTVLENSDAASDPRAALSVARSALMASPKNEPLRKTVLSLYRTAYADHPQLDAALEASGLPMERPARTAMKLLDVYLEMNSGDTLISRMDDRAVEIINIDRANGIVTLRRPERTMTVPATDLAREYDRVDKNDFRVLRQLWPDRLSTLIEENPVALVIGLLRAYGGSIDLDRLKSELVPRYIEGKAWSKWWSDTRSALKRSPNVSVEGRSPVMLRYSEDGARLEDAAWRLFQQQSDANHWLSVVEGYLRDKSACKESPDAALLAKFHDHIVAYIASVRAKRPGEALTCALTLVRLADKGLPVTDPSRGLATELLRESREPARMIRDLPDEVFWTAGLTALRAAHPDDWADAYAALLPVAPATQLDTLADGLIEASRSGAVQQFVDAAVADPVHKTEAIYWLWKGPRGATSLSLPAYGDLLRTILGTWAGLGRSAGKTDEAIKQFRQRIRSALALRDFSRARECFEKCDEAAAITIRRQLERLDGIGETARGKLLDRLRDAHPRLWVKRTQEAQPWEDESTLYTTQAGLDRRTAERDDIQNVQMRDNARRIGEAAALGDLSENSEYKFALEERDLLRARLARINDELSRARIFGPLDVVTDRIGIGARAVLRRVDNGEFTTMTFFGPFETDVDRGFYSYKAPVSQQLMGKAVGERVKLSMEGNETEYEIISIENGLLPQH